MTATARWPAGPAPHITALSDPPPGNVPAGSAGSGPEELAEMLLTAVDSMDAPDVVFALSRNGHRLIRSGGTGTPPDLPRDQMRYELGSASKTFTGLLLAHLIQTGRLTGGESAISCLAPARAAGEHPITLAHLITHTSGLPPLPADFYPQALPRWSTSPYAHYSRDQTIAAFLRARPRHSPGDRWRYSNFGVATLGHALAAATATPWETLLTSLVLHPLALTDVTLQPTPDGFDATGHRADGITPTPAVLIPGFRAAGTVRSTPHDLLTYLEAHLRPDNHSLAQALHAVRAPVLRRGLRHRHTHTLTWFRHPTSNGPLYFHSGATSGQQAFLGFHPPTNTALAAFATRRFRRADTFISTAYSLLAQEAALTK
ncbi:serine hydrolase domain-containing protein [Streptomyces sp. H27-C3]|uniref:serine hydrolase domain-containing protein n=1 Tax=Streptomyces sp. H27-C3 TaxID=3046305 RepID=UPI0024BA358A|nr:serine hydrolase domain-containing protein [Streptomyces sp. H27-C3]MDJ0466965.1 serine hydrolase domain-containing protein [Streptomyces sp. H27-C3]